MFHAVRQWWGSGRGKQTARLFLFELLVVTLGVLLAQGLQQEMQTRNDRIRMEEDRIRARQELATVTRCSGHGRRPFRVLILV